LTMDCLKYQWINFKTHFSNSMNFSFDKFSVISLMQTIT